MNHPPRVLAVHDLSGVGKCSLTVVLPILSAMGFEVAAMPTAILSAHTALPGFTYRDMTDDLPAFAAHWRALGLTFDALYSGWLASDRQAGIVSGLFDTFGRGALRVVDPVMGDEGRLYSTLTPARVEGMRALCRKADVITPNMTEAAFLLGDPYREGAMPAEAVKSLCGRLSALGAGRVVLTGVSTAEGTIGAAAYDVADGMFAILEKPRVPGVWCGTGDVFGAALLGALLQGHGLRDAAARAVGFTHRCIARTRAAGTDPRLGVAFEPELSSLLPEGGASDG